MEKSLIISLFQQQDKKRRRFLYESFSSQIQMKASLAFIAKFINNELGIEELISEADIKYCRHYFVGKAKVSMSIVPKIPSKSVSKPTNKPSSEISWTNPEDDNFISNQSVVKSKFSKQ
jgi:hypothetical protein